ncbi:MAG: sterol desaturase family protein [Proteobacteria bacterium]|nr:sterol desaturase family protein [Pseudomonadota bacterium]
MGRILYAAIATLTFPGLLVAAIGSAMWGLSTGVSEAWLAAGTVGTSLLVLLVLQRVQPAVTEWRWWSRDAAVDLLHMVFSTAGTSALVKALTLGLVLELATFAAQYGLAVWPSGWPLWVQLFAGLLVADFGVYWLHRFSHTYEPLWRLHALHHSSERLYIFSSGRNHPLHTAMTHLLQSAPLVILGAPGEVIALHAVFTGVHGMLQHANIDLWHGPLNLVFATADLHRWHHGTAMADSQSNYGNNVIVWDLLFGTYNLPNGRPHAVGIEGVSYPQNYWLQLASPWLLPRWEAEKR